MKTKPRPRIAWILGMMLSLLVILTACGTETAVETVVVREMVVETVVEKETVVEAVVETVVEEKVLVEGETAAEPAADAAAPAEGKSTAEDQLAAGPVSDVQPQPSRRLIIKDANLGLEVENTDRAIDGVTQIAGDLQGYIISQRIWYEQEAKFAAVTIAVPVQEFENALRRLRGLATRVLNESASGEDVTDQFVDLQSRLRNLQTTRDRIRSFMDQAAKVEEALEVNRQLSDIEDEIEQVQGRINYLQDRAAFSTITVNLDPILPTPTLTPTPTPTPTPMPTPTATPEAWRPGETVQEATDVLTRIVQGLIELLIWFTIVVGPFIVVLALFFWVVVKLGNAVRSRRGTAAVPPRAEEAADEEQA